MAGNTFGTAFRITTFGESHGPAIGVIIDGCPAGLEIDEEFIQSEMDRRRPGQSKIVTQRNEEDIAEILSGVFEGRSTGAPISMVIKNKDQRSKDYGNLKDIFRPSHADFTYQEKYGIRDYKGGGRSSARETAARVAAGSIAKLFLIQENIKITAFVKQVGSVRMTKRYYELDLTTIEDSLVRCPDAEISAKMLVLIDTIKEHKETLGGIIQCVIEGVEPGLGEPVFDKLHAELGKAMLSINAVKGFEFGSGFGSVIMTGYNHNDIFYEEDGIVKTRTNYSGGIQGGISNGMDIYFNVAFKPVSTVQKEQQTVDKDGNEVVYEAKGRHDTCVVPRAVPIVESMAAIVIADMILRKRTNKV